MQKCCKQLLKRLSALCTMMSGKPVPFAMRKPSCLCLEKELSFAPWLRQRYHLVHSTYCSPDLTTRSRMSL